MESDKGYNRFEYTTSWFPPPTSSNRAVHPKNYITKKPFVPQQSLEQPVVNSESKSTNTTENDGKEVQQIYQSIVTPQSSKSKKNSKKSSNTSNSNSKVFCSICNDFIDISIPLEVHLRTVPHLLSDNSTPPKSYYLQDTNKGYQMLKQMNWNEDQGLGARNQGSRDPIKTQIRFDRKGIGNETAKVTPPKVTHFKPGQIPKSEGIIKKKRKKNSKTQKKLIEKQQKAKEQLIRQSIYNNNPLLDQLNGTTME